MDFWLDLQKQISPVRIPSHSLNMLISLGGQRPQTVYFVIKRGILRLVKWHSKNNTFSEKNPVKFITLTLNVFT